MKNRESLYPGRVKLTAVDEANGIYDLVRADEPVEEGTPLNKRLLDFAVAACGVTTGTSTVYALDDEFGGFELVDGAKVNFRLHVASGANPTLNVNGTGAKALTDGNGIPLASSISSSEWITATYSKELDTYIPMLQGGEYNGKIANCSWATIAKISESGTASSVFQVGDEKDIVVDGETLTLVIMDFNHDDLESGGKAGITFGLKNLMATKRVMGSSNITKGFISTSMYSWMTEELLLSLPSELQAVIKTINKSNVKDYFMDYTSAIDAMKLFLFSETEIFGSITYSAITEGSQYGYFSTAASRIKRLSNGSGEKSVWWTRSPIKSTTGSHWGVVTQEGQTLGTESSDLCKVTTSQGVCFGFCV